MFSRISRYAESSRIRWSGCSESASEVRSVIVFAVAIVGSSG
jgi:hypothetical protein